MPRFRQRARVRPVSAPAGTGPPRCAAAAGALGASGRRPGGPQGARRPWGRREGTGTAFRPPWRGPPPFGAGAGRPRAVSRAQGVALGVSSSGLAAACGCGPRAEPYGGRRGCGAAGAPPTGRSGHRRVSDPGEGRGAGPVRRPRGTGLGALGRPRGPRRALRGVPKALGTASPGGGPAASREGGGWGADGGGVRRGVRAPHPPDGAAPLEATRRGDGRRPATPTKGAGRWTKGAWLLKPVRPDRGPSFLAPSAVGVPIPLGGRAPFAPSGTEAGPRRRTRPTPRADGPPGRSPEPLRTPWRGMPSGGGVAPWGRGEVRSLRGGHGPGGRWGRPRPWPKGACGPSRAGRGPLMGPAWPPLGEAHRAPHRRGASASGGGARPRLNVAQSVRATVCGAVGRRFEPDLSTHLGRTPPCGAVPHPRAFGP